MSDGRTLFCRGEEEEAEHDDIWDDTELIAAYDRALSSARAELGMTGGAADEKAGKKWRIGDFCRAVYSVDGLPYEAELLSVGGARGRLRFVGYGNEEDQPLARLQASAGKKARRKQEKEAEAERQAEGEEGEGEEEGGEEVQETHAAQEAEEAEEKEEEEEEIEVQSVDKSRQQAGRKSWRKQQGAGSVQSSSAAGQGQWGAGQSYPAVSHHPAHNYPAWGPWSAGGEHCTPAAGAWGPQSAPWGPESAPWGPQSASWGPQSAPWGAAPPPPAGPWGPSQAPHGFCGPSDAGPSLHAPPLPPPPPPPIPGDADPVQLANMLMSWYISGYHTGYYQASREAARSARTGRK